MISKINGGGDGQLYVILTSVCATINNYCLIYDGYSGLIFQHSLTNILNYLKGLSILYTNQRNHIDSLVSIPSDRREIKKPMIQLMIFFIN